MMFCVLCVKKNRKIKMCITIVGYTEILILGIPVWADAGNKRKGIIFIYGFHDKITSDVLLQ